MPRLVGYLEGSESVQASWFIRVTSKRDREISTASQGRKLHGEDKDQNHEQPNDRALKVESHALRTWWATKLKRLPLSI